MGCASRDRPAQIQRAILHAQFARHAPQETLQHFNPINPCTTRELRRGQRKCPAGNSCSFTTPLPT
jgi:hypothetical protein